MKQLTTFLLLILTATALGQDKEFYRNTTFFVDKGFIRLQHFNQPEAFPQRDVNGLLIGISTDFLATPKFHFDFKAGYRFVSDYAHPEAINTFFPISNMVDNFDYHGGWLGFGMSFGRRHLWETSGFIGGGRMIKTNSSLRKNELDIGFETGYKFISNEGITFRVGYRKNFGRNLLKSQMKSIYIGFGYTLQKTQGKVKDFEPKKHKKYTLITGNAYLGALTGDLIGINLQFDFLPYNRTYIDLGFGVSGQVGAEFDGDIIPATTAYGLALIGKNASKFEVSAGFHLPFYYYKSLPQHIHFGLGYRLVPDNAPITIRLGASTTGFLNAGLGFRIGGEKRK